MECERIDIFSQYCCLRIIEVRKGAGFAFTLLFVSGRLSDLKADDHLDRKDNLGKLPKRVALVDSYMGKESASEGSTVLTILN